jgi:hypothetical protein
MIVCSLAFACYFESMNEVTLIHSAIERGQSQDAEQLVRLQSSTYSRRTIPALDRSRQCVA